MKNKKVLVLLSLLKDNQKTVLTVLSLIVFADILFIPDTSDFILFSILIFYAFCLKVFIIKSKLTFVLCLLLLITMAISYIVSYTSLVTEKAAVWFVLFFAVGIVQKWTE